MLSLQGWPVIRPAFSTGSAKWLIAPGFRFPVGRSAPSLASQLGTRRTPLLPHPATGGKLSGTGLEHCCAINATTTASRGCGLPRVLPLPQRSALAVIRWLHHVSTPKTTIDYTATTDIALVSSARRKLRHDCHIVRIHQHKPPSCPFFFPPGTQRLDSV